MITENSSTTVKGGSSLIGVKLRAASIHLGISLAVLLPLLLLIVLAWFPPPLFRVQGVAGVVRLLVLAHLLVFPFLTFLVFRPGKKGLRFDLAVIAAVQLAALAYGAHAIHGERPRYVVFAVDRYATLAEKDVDFAAAGMAGFGDRPLAGPVYAFAEMPLGQAYHAFQEGVLFRGEPDLERRPEFWRPLESTAHAILAAAKPLVKLVEARPGSAEALRQVAVDHAVDPAVARFLPLVGKRRDFAAILDPETAHILAVVDTDPWLEE